jgi:hypothetical protein
MKDQMFLKLTVKDGKLYFSNKALEKKYNKFFSKFPDGTRVELYVGANNKKGSLPQLARLHASIRELANDVGYSFEEMKLNVKRHAGLCIVKNNVEHCKSFAECDAMELSLAIQACLEIGDFNGVQLR